MTLTDPSGLLPVRLTDNLERNGDMIKWRRWALFFLILGVAVRCVRYFAHYPLWEDECFTVVSLYQRSFMGLLEPLEYHQVAPILFLWLGKLFTLIFGFNELALRLPAFLVSLASLWLVWHLSGRLLTGPARLFGIAFFAVAYPNIRYAAEYKAYGTDMFSSLVMIVLLVEWLRDPGQRKWLLALIGWTPLAIGLSFPAIFTAGGASLIWLLVLWTRRGGAKGWGLWLVYNVVVAVSFILIFKVVVAGQMSAEIGFMSDYWRDSFPPRLTHPLAFMKWVLLTHTGAMFGYPAGSNNGGSSLTAILGVVGLIVLLKRGCWKTALLFLAPLSLHLGAAVMEKYPYGGHVKFMMYLSSMLNLVIGVGAAVLLESHASRASELNLKIVTRIVLILLTLAGVVCAGMDVVHPYKNKADQRIRGFSQWFWYNAEFEGDVYCMKGDLGIEFSERSWSDLSWSAMYLCNQYIYRPEKIIRKPRPKYYPESANKVFYVVVYKDFHYKDFDQAGYDQWVAQAEKVYRLVSRFTLPLVRNDKRERKILLVDEIEVLKFEVESGAPSPQETLKCQDSSGSFSVTQ